MKRRYWAVRINGEDGEWWMHRDDPTDAYASPDVFLTRDQARALKRLGNTGLEGDRLEVVELAIIRSTGS